MHLRECVGQIPTTNLLGVLELEKLGSTMPRHVDQDITALICHQSLAARNTVIPAVRQQPDEVLDGDFVPAVVNFHILAVQVQGPVGVVVDSAGEGVAGVAGHVIGEHEQDLRVGDSQPFDCTVEGQRVG